MIRVLHIIPNLVPDGAERVVGTLASRTSGDRFECAVVSLFGEIPGTLAAPLRDAGIRVFHLNKRRGLDLRMFHRIFGVLREFRPDVIHTHNYVLRYVLPPALVYNPPVIVHTIHNLAHLEVDRLGLWLQRPAFRRRVQPVVIAEECAASFERTYGAPPEGPAQPPLIRNGIDVARYSAAQEDRIRWRTVQGFDADDLLFTSVARFHPQKNHQSLVAAFAMGPAQIPGAKLLLVGDGPLRGDVEAQVNALRLADKVRFLGRRDDIPEVLAACDVFALASQWEGNPLAVMEAMAAGLPCVATAVGGVPELVANEIQGLVVPPGDTAALSAAMLRLATDPAMRDVMGCASAKRAATEFDDRNMVKAYESLYDQLLSAPAEGRAGCLAIDNSTAA